MLTELELLERGLLEEDLDLFSPERNPRVTPEVAALVFVVDQRPAVLYDECKEIQERIDEVMIEAQAMVAKVQPLAGERKAKPKSTSTKRCKVCQAPVDGNRKSVCHACSRLKWEDEPGKGGRHAAQLQERFRAERDAMKERTRKAIAELKKKHQAELKRLQSDLSRATIEAEQRQEDAQVLALLIELAQEAPDGEFAQAFNQKLRLARELSAKGFGQQS